MCDVVKKHLKHFYFCFQIFQIYNIQTEYLKRVSKTHLFKYNHYYSSRCLLPYVCILFGGHGLHVCASSKKYKVLEVNRKTVFMNFLLNFCPISVSNWPAPRELGTIDVSLDLTRSCGSNTVVGALFLLSLSIPLPPPFHTHRTKKVVVRGKFGSHSLSWASLWLGGFALISQTWVVYTWAI